MNNNRQTFFENAERVVVKVGSGVLTRDDGLNLDVIASISRQICELISTGKQVILVSSGAVASGVRKANLGKRPDKMPEKQAAAAIGQAGLILEYDKAFSIWGKNVAQVLLTRDDLSNRRRYLNARNTLNTLLAWGVVPIINENDTVMVEEIKFGDNDNLSAMITLLLNADILINLTDIDGLYDKDPRVNNDATLIQRVEKIGRSIERLANDIPGAVGTGGMLSKIRAAKKTTYAGVPMVISCGADDSVLSDLFSGVEKGTFFVPKNGKRTSKKNWLAFSSKPSGIIVLDDGARTAVVERGKSLLPSGIASVSGDFGIGAPVECRGLDNELIGVGLVNYTSSEIELIKGSQSGRIKELLGYKEYDEVIHRDNLAVTGV